MKLLFLLMVYFAGFATAVYFLEPLPESQNRQSYEDGSYEDCAAPAAASSNSQEFIKSFNKVMRTCALAAKDATIKAGKFIKQKIEQGKLKNQQVADAGY